MEVNTSMTRENSHKSFFLILIFWRNDFIVVEFVLSFNWYSQPGYIRSYDIL
jgi:hypothetical protein